MKALAQRVERAGADVAVDDAERAERQQTETGGVLRRSLPWRGRAAVRAIADDNWGDDVEELPDSRRQTICRAGQGRHRVSPRLECDEKAVALRAQLRAAMGAPC